MDLCFAPQNTLDNVTNVSTGSAEAKKGILLPSSLSFLRFQLYKVFRYEGVKADCLHVSLESEELQYVDMLEGLSRLEDPTLA